MGLWLENDPLAVVLRMGAVGGPRGVPGGRTGGATGTGEMVGLEHRGPWGAWSLGSCLAFCHSERAEDKCAGCPWGPRRGRSSVGLSSGSCPRAAARGRQRPLVVASMSLQPTAGPSFTGAGMLGAGCAGAGMLGGRRGGGRMRGPGCWDAGSVCGGPGCGVRDAGGRMQGVGWMRGAGLWYGAGVEAVVGVGAP